MLLRTTSYLVGVLLALAICAPNLFGCLNPIGQYYISDYFSLYGVTGPDLVRKLTGHQDRAYWQDVLKQLLEKKRERSDEYSANNHAVALAHLGKVKEAIAILEELERKEPGEYATAANLGTVYELSGENEKALRWIKEGFGRNSQGHSGSEWLHVKILEIKLKLRKEPDWLTHNTVLNIRFGEETDPSNLHTTDHRGRRQSLKEIESALSYQLHERLEFVKQPDPVVADLLADLSSVFAITRNPEDSQAVYDLAKSYGTPRAIYVKPPSIGTSPDVPADIPTRETWSSRSIALGVAAVFGLIAGLAIVLRFYLRSK